MWIKRSSTRNLVILFSLVTKLGILFIYGVFTADDTRGYTDYAHQMLSDAAFWYKVSNWGTTFLPIVAFRPIGYPTLIAAMEALFKSNYGYAVVIIQITFSMYIAFLLFLAVKKMTRSDILSLASMLFFIFSESIRLDNSILSDSKYSSLFNMFILNIILSFLMSRPMNRCEHALLGAVWALSILIRDVGLYLTAIPLIMLLIVWISTGERAKNGASLAFFLPIVVTLTLYTSWNNYRTGESFISLTSVANYLQPAFAIKKSGYSDPFSGDDIIDKEADLLTSYDYTSQSDFLNKIYHQLGLTSPIQLKNLVKTQYIKTITEYPFSYLRYILHNLNPQSFGEILVDPLFTYNDFFSIGCTSVSKSRSGLWDQELT